MELKVISLRLIGLPPADFCRGAQEEKEVMLTKDKHTETGIQRNKIMKSPGMMMGE